MNVAGMGGEIVTTIPLLGGVNDSLERVYGQVFRQFCGFVQVAFRAMLEEGWDNILFSRAETVNPDIFSGGVNR